MRRRDFIKIAISGSAAAWSLATRAQQPPTVIGFLRPTRAEESGDLVAAVREGLRDSGYSSDKVMIESRWGDGRDEELPKLARELVALPVAAIVASSIPAARAAKAAKRCDRSWNDAIPRRPTTGIAGCCARPASGHTAVEPAMTLIKSRRARNPPK